MDNSQDLIIDRWLPASKSAWLLALVFLLGITLLGYSASRQYFIDYAAIWTWVSLFYFGALWDKAVARSWRFWLLVGIAARCILLPSEPHFSEDHLRFIWDGRMWLSGLHPFGSTPEQVMREGGNALLHADLVDKMNSPGNYTCYPAVCQIIYAMAAAIGGKSIFVSTIIMKVIILGAELSILYLLTKLLALRKQPAHWVLVYALHPLPIFEGIGNVHFEPIMLALLLLSYYALQPGAIRPGLAAGAFALAVHVKLLPLMLLPLFFKRWPLKQAIGWVVASLLLVTLLFAPLLLGVNWAGFASSLNLYFQHFEFNASVYYLCRSLGFSIWGYNNIAFIGPMLALITCFIIFIIALKQPKAGWYNLVYAMVWIWIVYLLFTTTVHPWYLILPLGLGVLTTQITPRVWAIVAALSYAHYAYGHEVYWLITLEYTVVLLAILYDVRWIRVRLNDR